ncbi:DUF1499 domain-containing protein [Pseudomonas sp. EL_65y_Pfl2_R95]|uniref:DUF1499 domain-containing protein n=1 Tax=Pseudomonas sp. EL_65y_Pfl2_R95 TaxID=3088698 RepID=UPI0030DDD7EC
MGSAFVLALCACSASPPATLGVHAGRFEPCPSSPNCVNSQATDSEHKIAPLALNGDPAETQALLLRVIAEQPRAKLTKAEGNYLRFEFTSAVMRFVDDVEFLVGNQRIEVRSASRLGYSDMGVNRERIETIRNALAEQK